jgi:hypothetical protein
MRIKTRPLTFWLSFLVVAFLPLRATFGDVDSRLCVRKRSVSGKIQLSREIRSTTGACPAGFAKVLDAAKDQDGAGSGLDADLLDGISSDGFATAGQVATLSETVSSLSTSINTLTDSVTEVSSTINAANIVTVATGGGNFTSLEAAIASLSNPSSTNRYLIKVGPGVFGIGASTLVIPQGVHVQGAGRDSTTITGDIGTSTLLSAANAVVALSDGSQLSALTVQNTNGASTHSFGIAAVGIAATDTSTPALFPTRLENIRVRLDSVATGRHYGLFVRGADLAAKDIEIYVTGSTDRNRGVDVTLDASYLYLEGASIRADNNDNQDSGLSMNLGTTEIHRSVIYGFGAGVLISGGTLRASYTTLQSELAALDILQSGATNDYRFVHGRLIADGVGGDGLIVTGVISPVVTQTEIWASDNVDGTATCAAITTETGQFFPTTCE